MEKKDVENFLVNNDEPFAELTKIEEELKEIEKQQKEQVQEAQQENIITISENKVEIPDIPENKELIEATTKLEEKKEELVEKSTELLTELKEAETPAEAEKIQEKIEKVNEQIEKVEEKVQEVIQEHVEQVANAKLSWKQACNDTSKEDVEFFGLDYLGSEGLNQRKIASLSNNKKGEVHNKLLKILLKSNVTDEEKAAGEDETTEGLAAVEKAYNNIIQNCKMPADDVELD
jgi:hypothetical protein